MLTVQLAIEIGITRLTCFVVFLISTHLPGSHWIANESKNHFTVDLAKNRLVDLIRVISIIISNLLHFSSTTFFQGQRLEAEFVRMLRRSHPEV